MKKNASVALQKGLMPPPPHTKMFPQIIIFFSVSTAHPRRLVTDLTGNPLECGPCMCWIKQAERDGWLSYRIRFDLPGDGRLDCVNYDETWEDVDLGCGAE